MRNLKIPYLILGIGLGSFVVAVGAYSYVFGTRISDSHLAWAEFGSFFGGVLNPILAFLAVVMLFITLLSQMTEFRKSVEYLDASARTAREELELLKSQNLDNETLSVLANADQQITLLLQSDVSAQGSELSVTMFHIALESRRFENGHPLTGAYAQFVQIARTPGTVVWSYVHALSDVVTRVVEILRAYSVRHSGQYSPTMMYYHHRVVGLSRMLADVGYLTEDERVQIVTMADQHG